MTDWDKTDSKNKEEMLEKVREKLLEEGFDCGIVIASWSTEDATTRTCNKAFGNWFGVNGLLRHVCLRRDEDAKLEQRDQHMKNNMPEEGP